MIGTRLFGRWPGVISGVTLVLGAFVVHFWQWARGYSVALLLTTLATYALLRVFETGGRRWAVLWCVSLALACWLNLFAISILAAHAVAYRLIEPKPPKRLVAVSTAALLLAVTPLIVLVATADNGQLNWIPTPTLRRVLVQSWDWSSRNPFALIAAAVAVTALVRRARRPTDRWKAGLVITWTLAPFVLTLLLSAVQPAFDSHYLLTAAAGLALLVAVGVAALPRAASLTLLALVIAGAGLQLAHYYIAPGKPLSHLI
jgi:mannosyltransferase